ncbi:MAG: tRNA (guanosine(37)-N1)-methyltransferase TrmD [Chloroflexi bacterium]|nr:tRNA (guanosine(37)-N1)-methyltransferase TrmD [Chloroflexota bacterium]MDA1297309.1 tRNA (guanosine(37)-N1)-methyltransferase TrmD [Chloroflexota bacterium]
MLQIDIITLFPEMFAGPFSASIVGRAVEARLVEIELHQLRDFAHDRHRTVDDTQFGGGPGMVLKAEPLLEAVAHVRSLRGVNGPNVVLLSPQGRTLTHRKVAEMSGHESVTLVCGHYEGVDQRFIDIAVDEEISIGDYVLTGGELPAMVLVDAMTRLLPGALGDEQSAELDSFSPGLDGLLQGPVYTRPKEIAGRAVPDVLLSGDHARVEKWRREQAVKRTRERRPELLEDWPG